MYNILTKILFILLFILFAFKIPKPIPSLHDSFSYSKIFLDSEGGILRFTLDKKSFYREKINFKDIPKNYLDLLLKKEDQYFYYHLGVNPISLIRAFIKTYLLKSTTSGASTLSMQLARLQYKLKTRTPFGKLKQIIAASYLEFLYTKKEILVAYANLAPFGGNIEGIAAATRIYFHKNLQELSDAEVLFLVSLPQRPAVMNSHKEYAAIPETLANSMTLLTKKKFDRNSLWVHGRKELPFKAPHAIWQVLQRNKEAVNGELVTTIKPKIHNTLVHLLASYVQRNRQRGLSNAAAMVLNYKTMEIESLVGSANYFDDTILGQVDGTLSKRSPGSTLKPLAYAMALEKGLIHPQSMLMDAPLPFRTPENFDQKFLGPMSATMALIKSRNVPAVWLTSKLKKPSVYDNLKLLGVTGLRERGHYGTSIILGGVELTMLELVNIYAMFANGGVLKKMKFLHETEKPKREKNSEKRILSEEAVTMMLSMLAENPRPGFDTRFSSDHSWPVYWKTGTSYGFRDAWSIGITGPYVVAVWMGNFNGESHPNLIGAKAAAPLFFEVVDFLKSESPHKDHYYFAYSENLTEEMVCALSGRIPTEHCRHKVKTLFWPGVSPIKKCPIHRAFLINKKSGLRSCRPNARNNVSKIYEVWPTHLMDVFAQLGVPRKAPPLWPLNCRIGDKTEVGNDPLILSPKRGLDYNIRLSSEHNIINFLAQTDSDVAQVYWYLGEEFIAKTSPKRPFLWPAKAGQYLLKVVDDRGRVALRKLKVILTQ